MKVHNSHVHVIVVSSHNHIGKKYTEIIESNSGLLVQLPSQCVAGLNINQSLFDLDSKLGSTMWMDWTLSCSLSQL